MAEAELSQAEADALLRMEKHRLSDDVVPFPAHGQNISIALRSTVNREEFLLDVWRAAKTGAEPDSRSEQGEWLSWLASTSAGSHIVTGKTSRTYRRHISTSIEKGGEAAGQGPCHPTILLR